MGMTADQARKMLSEAVFEGMPLREVIDLCEDILGTPLRFTLQGKPDGGFLSRSYPKDDFLDWKELVAPQGKMTNAYRIFLSSEYAFAHGMAPYFYDARPPVHRRRILCMALIGNRRMGHISVPETGVPLEEVDFEQISLCARFIALSCSANGGMGETFNDEMAMKRLISGERDAYSQIAMLASDQIFAERGRYRLLELRPTGTNGRGALTALCARLTGWLSSTWLAQTREGAVLLYEDRPMRDTALLTLQDQLKKSGCACLIGPVYSELMQTPVWHRRLTALRPFARAEAGSVLYYEDWADYGLFRETGLNQEQLRAFVCQPVQEMERYDRENGTAYLQTLNAYLEQGANQRRTAEALFVHINTVAYRLQRMRELFGLALDEPGMMLKAARSVRLIDYLEQDTTEA